MATRKVVIEREDDDPEPFDATPGVGVGVGVGEFTGDDAGDGTARGGISAVAYLVFVFGSYNTN